MVFDNIQIYTLQPAIIILSLITAFFAYKMINVLNKEKNKNELDSMLSKVFKTIGIGFLISVLAEIIYEISVLLRVSVTPGFADIFYVAGYLFLIWGFGYFAEYMYHNSRKKGKEVMIMTIAAIITGAVVFRIINDYTYGFNTGASGLQIFLDYFYAIAGAALVVASSSVFCFFRKLGKLGKPLLFLAIATIFDFIGNLLWDYYTWNNTYGIPGITSDLSFVICYVLVIATFVTIIKQKKTKK